MEVARERGAIQQSLKPAYRQARQANSLLWHPSLYRLDLQRGKEKLPHFKFKVHVDLLDALITLKQEAGVDYVRGTDGSHAQSGPLVSVIIPTYNRIGVLGRAIQSVIDQTYTHYEIIVVDDGSKDDTSDWLAKQFPAVCTVRHRSNQGVAAARNSGLLIAKGNIIAFLDSDDVWRAAYLERQVASLAENQSAVFSYCGRYLALRGRIRESVTCIPIVPTDFLQSMLLSCFVHSMSQIVIPRAVFERVGLRFDERLPTCEDFELYLRLLSAGNPVRLDEDLLVKHCLLNSCSLRDRGKSWLEGFFRALEIFYMTPKSIPYSYLRPIAEASIYKQIANCLFEALLGNGSFVPARVRENERIQSGGNAGVPTKRYKPAQIVGPGGPEDR